jgi:hypothetical protein
MECCGDPFAVGDTVNWTLLEQESEQAVIDEAGRRQVLRCSHREENHGGVPDGAPVTRGQVTRLRAVYAEYAGGMAQDPGFVREKVGPVNGSESSDSPRCQFRGYVVDVQSGDR